MTSPQFNPAALRDPQELDKWISNVLPPLRSDLDTFRRVAGYFSTVLLAEHIDGDKRGAARWRSRKVRKSWKKAVAGLDSAIKHLERSPELYSDNRHYVAQLPAARAAKKKQVTGVPAAKQVGRGPQSTSLADWKDRRTA